LKTVYEFVSVFTYLSLHLLLSVVSCMVCVCVCVCVFQVQRAHPAEASLTAHRYMILE